MISSRPRRSIKVGDGLADGVSMGPLPIDGALEAMEALTADAVSRGAKVAWPAASASATAAISSRRPCSPMFQLRPG